MALNEEETAIVDIFRQKFNELIHFRNWYLKMYIVEPKIYNLHSLKRYGFERVFNEFKDLK